MVGLKVGATRAPPIQGRNRAHQAHHGHAHHLSGPRDHHLYQALFRGLGHAPGQATLPNHAHPPLPRPWPHPP